MKNYIEMFCGAKTYRQLLNCYTVNNLTMGPRISIEDKWGIGPSEPLSPPFLSGLVYGFTPRRFSNYSTFFAYVILKQLYTLYVYCIITSAVVPETHASRFAVFRARSSFFR
jgi:hypothetical protein